MRKSKKSNYLPLILVLILLIIGTTAIILFPFKEEKTTSQMFMDHVKIFDEDVLKMNHILDEYSNVSATDEEKRVSIDKFIKHYKLKKQHLDEFNMFIESNQDELISLDVDVEQAKRDIEKAKSIMNENIGYMVQYLKIIEDNKTILELEELNNHSSAIVMELV